jgi:hypothetical protein
VGQVHTGWDACSAVEEYGTSMLGTASSPPAGLAMGSPDKHLSDAYTVLCVWQTASIGSSAVSYSRAGGADAQILSQVIDWPRCPMCNMFPLMPADASSEIKTTLHPWHCASVMPFSEWLIIEILINQSDCSTVQPAAVPVSGNALLISQEIALPCITL